MMENRRGLIFYQKSKVRHQNILLTNFSSMNFKDIHIGELIKKRISETEIENHRICAFLNSTEEEINRMYKAKDLSTDILLRWSKLLEYDFFRMYSQHLILYAPVSKSDRAETSGNERSELPRFRKNIYTREVIFFILELVEKKEKTIVQITNEYNIPKSTLNNWIKKYKN